jgi:hypothetical protein
MPYDVSQAVAARAAVRQAKILGKPQRIPPLTPDEYTEEALVLTASIDAAVGLTPVAVVCYWIGMLLSYL